MKFSPSILGENPLVLVQHPKNPGILGENPLFLVQHPKNGPGRGLCSEVGSCEAVRLLLYAGAQASRTVRCSLPYGHGRMVLPAQAVHVAPGPRCFLGLFGIHVTWYSRKANG